MGTLSSFNRDFVLHTQENLIRGGSVVPPALFETCLKLLEICRTDEHADAATSYVLQALECDFIDKLKHFSGQTRFSCLPLHSGPKIQKVLPHGTTVEIAREKWSVFCAQVLGGKEAAAENVFLGIGKILGAPDLMFRPKAPNLYRSSKSILLQLAPIVSVLRVFREEWLLPLQPTTETFSRGDRERLAQEGVLLFRVHTSPYQMPDRKKEVHPYLIALLDLLYAVGRRGLSSKISYPPSFIDRRRA